MSELAKYWRCMEACESSSAFRKGAVYETVRVYPRNPSYFVLIEDVEMPGQTQFIPWTVAPGDYVKFAKALGGDEMLVESVEQMRISKCWQACGHVGKTRYAVVQFTPVLDKAPHKPIDELHEGDQVEQIAEWVGEVKPNKIGTRRTISQINTRHSSNHVALSHAGGDHWMDFNFFHEHFRKISGGSPVRMTPEAVNAPAPQAPAAAIPSYIGASARHTAAMAARREAQEKIEYREKAHRQLETIHANAVVCADKLRARVRAENEAARRVIRPCRTGVYDLERGFES